MRPGRLRFSFARLIRGIGLGRFGLLGEEVGVFLERRLAEDRGLPELGREVAVRGRDRVEDSCDEIARRARVAARRRVAVLEASHGQDFLRGRSGDETGPARRRDETHADATAGAGELHGDRVRQAAVLPPVAAADRDEVHLRHDESTADGCSDLRGAFLAETNMSVEVADRNVGLEAPERDRR